MLSEVEQDVHEAVANFARRRERSRVVAIAPDRATSAPGTIDGAGHTTRQAVETSAQVIAGISLDDEMDVIGLNREVHESEVFAARLGERSKQRCECRLRSERIQAARRAQSDMYWMTRIVWCARRMGHIRPRARPLATGAIAPTTPGPR